MTCPSIEERTDRGGLEQAMLCADAGQAGCGEKLTIHVPRARASSSHRRSPPRRDTRTCRWYIFQNQRTHPLAGNPIQLGGQERHQHPRQTPSTTITIRHSCNNRIGFPVGARQLPQIGRSVSTDTVYGNLPQIKPQNMWQSEGGPSPRRSASAGYANLPGCWKRLLRAGPTNPTPSFTNFRSTACWIPAHGRL